MEKTNKDQAEIIAEPLLEIIEEVETISREPLLKTTQNNLLVPTGELIKLKVSDFRVLCGISYLTNCDNVEKKGNNSRYVSIRKVDNNMKKICDGLKIDVEKFRRQVRGLLKNKSNEFKLIKKTLDGRDVDCYEINYSEGTFVTIPIEKAEKVIFGLGNSSIKLYANLLWLCWDKEKEEYIERQLTYPFLLDLMGLSVNSARSMRIAIDMLKECGFIDVREEWQPRSVVTNQGIVVGTKPVKILFYSIKL